MILRKNDNFELEICVKARGGRAARCMGSVVVAEIVASEARRPQPTGARQSPRAARTTTPLYAFSRAIDRESLAGLGNSLKLAFLGGHPGCEVPHVSAIGGDGTARGL